MSPSPQSPNSTATTEKKKKKQRQNADSGDARTTTFKRGKKRPLEHEDDHYTEHKVNSKRKEHKPQEHHDDGEENKNDNNRKKKWKNKDAATEIGRITDPRFASVHRDPKFERMPKHHSKVTIDSRFADVFNDKRFASSTAPVDKRGKARKGKPQNPLLHYYVNEEEFGAEEIRGNAGGSVGDAADGGEDVLLDGPGTLPSDEESGELGSSSSSSSSSEDEDDDQYSVSSDVAHYLMGNHEDTPQTEQVTHRLAVVNMDWDHIKAVDIYVVTSSCLLKDGHISSVAIYPSEFGLKCMEIEAFQGPSALINGGEEQDDSDMEDSDAVVDNEKENEKLRIYELNRLRYYYAVVDCDSSITANHLYEALDGTELLKTSNVFDLRFIPDSMEFTHPPRDIATEAPTCYKEPDFHTRALQHSNVKLSWEDDEPKRKKILRRKFTADQLDDLEFKEFLASDDEDSDEDGENDNLLDGEVCKLKKGEKYLALLQSADGSDADGDGQDMEITFNTGLEDIAKRALEKKGRKSETVWEAYLRRRKEQKKARKKNTKYSSEDDDESDSDYQQVSDGQDRHDDFFEEELSDDVEVDKGKTGNYDSSKVKSKKSKNDKKHSKKMQKGQEASKAELELLCANADRPESPSMDDTIPKKVKKKGKKLPAESKLPKEDYHDDPRFSALFSSHLYALDPTDSQFKRSATYARQMIQKQKHSSQDEQRKNPLEQGHLHLETIGGIGLNDSSTGKEQAEFLSVVRSLKRRTEALRSEKKGK